MTGLVHIRKDNAFSDAMRYLENLAPHVRARQGAMIIEALMDSYSEQRKELTTLREENERLKKIERLARKYIISFKRYMNARPMTRENFKEARNYRIQLEQALENSNGRD